MSGGQHAPSHGQMGAGQPASGHGHTGSLHAASGHGHDAARSGASGHSAPAGAAPAGHPSAADRVHDAGQPAFNAAEVYTLGGIGQAAAQRSAGGESGGIHAIHPATAAGGVSVGHNGRSGASRGLTGGGEAAFSGGGDGQPFLDGVSIAAQENEAEDWAKVAKVKPGGERLLYLAGANEDRLRVPDLAVIASMKRAGCNCDCTTAVIFAALLVCPAHAGPFFSLNAVVLRNHRAEGYHALIRGNSCCCFAG